MMKRYCKYFPKKKKRQKEKEKEMKNLANKTFH